MAEKYKGHKQMHPAFPKMGSGNASAGVVNSTPAGDQPSFRDFGPTQDQQDMMDASS